MSARKPNAKDVAKVEESIEKVEKVISQMADEIPLLPEEFRLGFEPFTGMAAWYIDAAEEFALRAIALQEQGARWLNNTPWGVLLKAQADVSRRFVEDSASMVRDLWRPSSSHPVHHHKPGT
jgi:hypothetical protein